MRANVGGHEAEFTIRHETTDAKLISHIWNEDCYRLIPLQKKHPDIETILEIGAHIGVFSALSAMLWPKADIRVYEAWEDNYYLLTRHCSRFPNVHAINLAVIGWEATSVEFRLPQLHQGNTGDGRIDNANMPNKHFTTSTVHVASRSITKVLALWGVHSIGLLKLDCEGSEIPIIETLGRIDFLKNIRFIRGEWHGGSSNRERLMELLSKTHQMEFAPPKNTSGLFWGESKT